MKKIEHITKVKGKGRMKTISKPSLLKELKKLQSKERFAVFYSPGTFFSESNSIEIKGKIDLKALCKQAKSIVQRYNATPYGFMIQDGNGETLSGMYYITGELIFFHNVPDDSSNSIFMSNMRSNNMPIAIENKNSYKFIGSFNEKDVIVDWEGNIIKRGDDPLLVEYRKEKMQEFKEYYNKS